MYKALSNIAAGRFIPAGSVVSDEEFQSMPDWLKVSFQKLPDPAGAADGSLKPDSENASGNEPIKDKSEPLQHWEHSEAEKKAIAQEVARENSKKRNKK